MNRNLDQLRAKYGLSKVTEIPDWVTEKELSEAVARMKKNPGMDLCDALCMEVTDQLKVSLNATFYYESHGLSS